MKNYRQLQQILFGHRNLRRLFCAKVIKSSTLQDECKDCTEKLNQIVPLFKKGLMFADKVCITDFNGQYTYMQLYANSKRLSRQISNICGSGSGSSIAFFYSNDVLTVLILWAIWMSGQTAMALKRDLGENLLVSLFKTNKTRLIISSDKYENCSCKIACDNSIPLIKIDHKFLQTDQENQENSKILATRKKAFFEGVLFNDFYNNSAALCIYTDKSEETTRITLLSHKHLNAQIRKAVQALNISGNERILYICPSSHSSYVGYIFNMLFPLSVGSHVFILEPFDAKSAWSTILGLNIPLKERVDIMIAEPEVYQLLIQEYNNMFTGDHQMIEYIKDYCQRNIRLMMSCLMSLNSSIFSTWLEITGHSLLECDFLNDYLNSRTSKDYPDTISKNHFRRLRIVDANDNVLLELDDFQRFRTSHTPIIGRLLIAKASNETFHYTGEIVAYCNGVFMKVGRYHYRSN
ncbi:malonate--CoA ligase ACSF3, mitochondrial isoform X2 [Lucilia sericata]|uniref:malonate--CoA ligase ACSF3, mitochondrial isoform X2 n=1 Tax=Lucilia sericata TaxID=13632 RepID=UPI0018A8492B|nr:malonate--CoA ligase ACSF3, mitochondrial isoform X2 [Lucilia sericata]